MLGKSYSTYWNKNLHIEEIVVSYPGNQCCQSEAGAVITFSSGSGQVWNFLTENLVTTRVLYT
jgi:hypothetical protein